MFVYIFLKLIHKNMSKVCTRAKYFAFQHHSIYFITCVQFICPPFAKGEGSRHEIAVRWNSIMHENDWKQ